MVNMSEIKTTAKERKAIERLQRAINKMPDTLWLFNTGQMHVMKYGPEGKVTEGEGGGFDPRYRVATIDGIISDGGDW